MAGGSACVALSLLGLVGYETRSCEVSDDACGCLRLLIVDQILRRVKGSCLGEGHNLGGLDEYLEMISLMSLAYRYLSSVWHRVYEQSQILLVAWCYVHVGNSRDLNMWSAGDKTELEVRNLLLVDRRSRTVALICDFPLHRDTLANGTCNCTIVGMNGYARRSARTTLPFTPARVIDVAWIMEVDGKICHLDRVMYGWGRLELRK